MSDTVRQNLMAAITMSSDEAKARVNAVLERRVPKVGRRKRAMMKMGMRSVALFYILIKIFARATPAEQGPEAYGQLLLGADSGRAFPPDPAELRTDPGL